MTRQEREKIENQWIAWERSLNKELDSGGSQYRVVFLPPKDLMPYEDAGLVTKIQDETEKMLDRWRNGDENATPVGVMRMDEEWAKTINMALTVYKTVLMTIHGERFRKEIREAAEKRKKEDGHGKRKADKKQQPDV